VASLVIPGLGVHLASTASPAGDGLTVAELLFGLGWLASLVLPLHFGLRLRRRPTARDLFTPFPSGEWVRFTLKLLSPIELGIVAVWISGLDDRVPTVAKIPAWLLVAAVTIAATVGGFRRAPPASQDGVSSQQGAELPGYEQSYARTIAALEDSLAPAGRATRRRRRGRGTSGPRRKR
jgi:hypothetical protein